MIYGNRVADLFKSTPKDSVSRAEEYWEGITPKNKADYFKRWLFSFMSVHTTWEANVRGYLLLRDMDWLEDKSKLAEHILNSRAGLITVRCKGIWEFTQMYWNDPGWWVKRQFESWQECRERLSNNLHGLGLAKTAFALEMCYPRTCEVVCLDTHMLQLYGTKDYRKTNYIRMENHWMKKCNEHAVASPVFRNVVWNVVQKQEDTTYWTYVFH